MLRIGMMVRKTARAAEKAGKHDITAGGIRGTRSQQVRRHDAEQRAQLKNIPSLAPQYGNARPFPRQWVALPRNGLDQRGLAAAIRPQDAHVLSARDLQVDVMECRSVTAHYRDMRKGEQGRRDGDHSGLNGLNRPAVAPGDDNVILTEPSCDARDHGRRMSEQATL